MLANAAFALCIPPVGETQYPPITHLRVILIVGDSANAKEKTVATIIEPTLGGATKRHAFLYPMIGYTIQRDTAFDPMWKLPPNVFQPAYAAVGMTVRESPAPRADRSVETVVLTGAKPVENWSRQNSLKAPSAELSALMEGYGKKRAPLLAVTFMKDAAGPVTLPPLFFVARSPDLKPTLPLRMWKLAGAAVEVELFVIAKGVAGMAPLQAKETGKLSATQIKAWAAVEPQLGALAWENATITRLAGVIRPEQMEQDIEVTVQ